MWSIISSPIAEETAQLEHWGCPWSRKPDGHVNVRAFSGKTPDRAHLVRRHKTGFHMLHTLFQTSLQFPSMSIFALIVVEEWRAGGDQSSPSKPDRW